MIVVVVRIPPTLYKIFQENFLKRTTEQESIMNLISNYNTANEHDTFSIWTLIDLDAFKPDHYDDEYNPQKQIIIAISNGELERCKLEVHPTGIPKLSEKIQWYFEDNVPFKRLSDWWCYAASSTSIVEFQKLLLFLWKNIKNVKKTYSASFTTCISITED